MKNAKWILVILCLGYFIDFYDLTVISVSYVDLFKEQFLMTNTTEIQQTYYLVSNIQMAGILAGALLFGSLADKFGRITVIKYSILLYSMTTLLSVVATNFEFFLALRFLAYLGLASEFGVSTVLIVEFFPRKFAAWGMSFLYILGVLGGVTATFVGVLSWKLMFVVGGLAGLLIYVFRNSLEESPEFIKLYNTAKTGKAGSLITLLKKHSKSLFMNFLITIPYFFTITVMFAMIKFISAEETFGISVKLFLFGFFIGNIISCIISGFYNQYFRSPNLFFILNLIIFIIAIFSYPYISEKCLLIYGIIIGFIGGGYNITWAQYAATEFPTEVRAIGTNSIYALGRTSSIGFGILFAYFIVDESRFRVGLYSMTVAIFIMVMLIVLFYKRERILEK
ncbi:MFS transporter [Francisella frigiditurris]|uniref:Sugar (And other) transporter family protein n=1 Tax=Francisella frigiditurris TaxID=1542390 RepID=A0A1J0KUM9_9GAMM|nr:MFS transporter [Francisella frigiditurris]APC97350.1 sugar (and other) transporter family protein [Francisella frigiditurris]